VRVATIDITETDIREVIDAVGIVFLDFWAEWCGPCKSFAAVYSAASEANPEHIVYGVSVEYQPHG
jgi:thioredoxin 1